MAKPSTEWKDADDVPETVFVDVSYSLVRAIRDGKNTPITHDEIRALLCILRPYSSLAVQYLEGE